MCRRLLVFALGCGLSMPSVAIEDRADLDPNQPTSAARPVAWKLTLGAWHDSQTGTASDVNLRGNTELDAFWIGYYHDTDDFRQLRAGWEHQFRMPFGRLIASSQLASQGFAGGSITAEIATDAMGPYSALIGWGRTNLKPYYNLNFDPNDSVLIGGAWKPDDNRSVTLFQVRDDRLDTAQRITHLVVRMPAGDHQHWSLDLFYRAGWASEIRDGNPVHHLGAAATLEHAPAFFRVAWDPRANFGPSDMLRISAGLRF